MMKEMEKRGVAFNTLDNLHYVDHLGVIAIIMGIPYLCAEESHYSTIKKLYPKLNVVKINNTDLNPEILVEKYDVLFLSDYWDRDAFKRSFSELNKKYQKEFRHVHCPHGFSDKGFYLKKIADEDIALIYGENMLDLLREFGVYENLNQYVITGNYRYTYYRQHQAFFDKIVADEILSYFENGENPVILYAPTWKDSEETTSFFDGSRALLQKLPSDYNLIVKLHPRLEDDDPVFYHSLLEKHTGKGNIVFIKDFPLVYPILAASSVYIGDMSSLGYDFLTFNRPMFFLNQRKLDSELDREGYLFQCGVEILPEDYENIYSVLGKNLKDDQEKFSEIRKKVYDYTFGCEKTFHQIKEEIIQAYNGSFDNV